MKHTLAAIDIGSNAIRLLISDVDVNNPEECKKTAFLRVPIRLGEDVFSRGRVSDEKRLRLCEAMKAFSSLMKVYGVESYRACATSAMREAENGIEIVEYIKALSDIDIEIITGQEEARTIYDAESIAQLINVDKSYIFVDVGGGSTEVCIYNNHRRVYSESFPLGTVRMLSNSVDKTEMKRFKETIEVIYSKYKPVAIIGSGGNINKIHKIMDKKEREPLKYNEIFCLYDKLRNISYEERIRKFRLNEYRADVIVPAMKIFLTIGRICAIEDVIVPKRGLADGIIRKLQKNLL